MAAVRDTTRRILNSWFGILVLVVCLFYLQMPYFFAVIPVLTVSIPYVRWILAFILGVVMLLLHERLRDVFRRELLFWGTLAWAVLLFVSTYMHGGELSNVKKDLIPSCLLAVLVFSVFSKMDLRKVLFTMFMYFLVINTLNNASVLFFANTGVFVPAGMSDPEYFFFGHINEGSTCAVNALLFGCLYSRQYEASWDVVNWANLLFSAVAAAAAECDVALVLYALVAAGLLLCYLYRRWNGLRKFLKWINLGTIMIADVLVEILVVPLGRIGWMERLGMDPGVHGRRALWDVVLDSIRRSPVFGNGYSSWFMTETNGEIEYFWHQHSMYLMMAYETGLAGILILGFLFVIAILELRRADLPVRLMTGLLVGGFMMTMTVECCVRCELFLMLGMCCYFAGRLQKIEMDV